MADGAIKSTGYTNGTDFFSLFKQVICPKLLSVKAPFCCLSCQSFDFYENHHFLLKSVSSRSIWSGLALTQYIFFVSRTAGKGCFGAVSDYQVIIKQEQIEKLSRDPVCVLYMRSVHKRWIKASVWSQFSDPS